MAAQKWTLFFSFLIKLTLFILLEEAKLSLAYEGVVY